MSRSTDPKSLVNLQFAEMASGARRKLPELFHPDLQILREGVQQAAAFILAQPKGGESEANPEELKGMGEAMDAAFPDSRLDIISQVSDGDTVVTRAVFSATHEGEFFGIPPTHNKIAFDEVFFMKVAAGKIIEVWVLGDELSLLQQLGAIPKS